MALRDWEQFGSDILNSIGTAIDTGDFTNLNNTVSDKVNQVLDGISGQRRYDNYGYQNQYGYQNTQQGYGNTNTYGGQNQTGRNAAYNGNTQQGYNNRNYAYANRQQVQDRFASGWGRLAWGIVLLCLGGILTLIFFIALLGLLLFPVAPPSDILTMVFSTAISVAIAGAGWGMIAGFRRIKSYVRVIGSHEYYEVQRLAQQTNYKPKLVQRDLYRMIRRRWFRQGCLDETGNCLILTDRAYQQYTQMIEQTRRQRQEEEARQQEEKRKAEAERMAKQRQADEEKQSQDERYAKLPPEVRQIILTGNDYIRQVHALNDQIPGEEVSGKISRMELLLDRIFGRVEEHPESAGDVRRLLDYYLPMTLKLLTAYRDMDAQPVQPANIVSSKQEIEKTLDTLNTAFEKLLDDLFMDTAWDLSSDISVLNTLLAQDGLTQPLS